MVDENKYIHQINSHEINSHQIYPLMMDGQCFETIYPWSWFAIEKSKPLCEMAGVQRIA